MKKINTSELHDDLCRLVQNHTGLDICDLTDEEFKNVCLLVTEVSNLCKKVKIGKQHLINARTD